MDNFAEKPKKENGWRSQIKIDESLIIWLDFQSKIMITNIHTYMQSQNATHIYIYTHKYIFQCYIYTSPPLPFLPFVFQVSMFDASAARKVDTLMLGLKFPDFSPFFPPKKSQFGCNLLGGKKHNNTNHRT